MKYGFVKIGTVSCPLAVGDVPFNTQKIIEEIEISASEGTEILVFPELSLVGYTAGDLLVMPTVLDACKEAVKEIAKATEQKQMLVYVGLPYEHNGKIYNCAVAISRGRVLAFIPKTNLPGDKEFSEPRWFSVLNENCYTDFYGEKVPFGTKILIGDKTHPEVKVACEICRDLFVPNPPSGEHALAGATVIVNLSAANEIVGKADYRRTLIASQSKRCCAVYAYANAGIDESTTDLVFSGHHLIYENGVCLAESVPFGNQKAVAEADVGFVFYERMKLAPFKTQPDGYETVYEDFVGDGVWTTRQFSNLPFIPSGRDQREQLELILSMQAFGLKKRMEHIKAKTAVIGLSGGLDSTLALLVIVRAFEKMGKDKSGIVCVNMPGLGTGTQTCNNAELLAKGLGLSLKTVSIKKSVLTHFEDIGQKEENHDTTYENAQARMRTLVLMDVANQTGGLVVGTGDLSELALGWCTYNGDQMSMYGVNASIPKTLVKELVAYEAERLTFVGAVLKDVLSTEISPELLPADGNGKIVQKTEDIVGPYELHDFFMYHVLCKNATPNKVYELAKYTFRDKYEKSEIKKWLVNFYKRFFSSQFKRSCAPDGAKVGGLSFSPRGDWKMPSDASGRLWITEAESLE